MKKVEKIRITIDELKERCPECAQKVLDRFGPSIKKVLISANYDAWLKMNKEERPDKVWWDRCVATISDKADDPATLCSWLYFHHMGGGSEAPIPTDVNSVNAVVSRMTREKAISDEVSKLKKDIETVGEWRKLGKAFTREQQIFAERVVDKMLEMRSMNKMGVHLIGKDKLEFIRKYEGGDRTSDETSYGSRQIAEPPRVSAGVKDVAKAEKEIPNRPAGDIKKPLPTSPVQSGGFPRNTAGDVAGVKRDVPKNQKDGKVTATADSQDKVNAKVTSSDDKVGDVGVENIGHNPNMPMPQKMAEELIGNVKWGVDIGAYTTIDEGISSQLTRKDYAEFIDTPDKQKGVTEYLKTIAATMKDPKEMI